MKNESSLFQNLANLVLEELLILQTINLPASNIPNKVEKYLKETDCQYKGLAPSLTFAIEICIATEITKKDRIPEAITNTKNILNVLDANKKAQSSRMIPIFSMNNTKQSAKSKKAKIRRRSKKPTRFSIERKGVSKKII